MMILKRPLAEFTYKKPVVMYIDEAANEEQHLNMLIDYGEVNGEQALEELVLRPMHPANEVIPWYRNWYYKLKDYRTYLEIWIKSHQGYKFHMRVHKDDSRPTGWYR